MRYDLCCFGELLVDFVASPAGESLANSVTFEKCAGGAPANVAVGATRLGCKTALIAKVGADPFGDFLVSCMRDNKVNVEGISRAPDVRTTLAFVSLMKNGERDFTFFRNPGADTEIRPSEVSGELIENSRVFHFGSLSLTHPKAYEATCHALRVAQNANVHVSMDPNIRLNLWDDANHARATILNVISAVNTIKVSEEELELITGESHPDTAIQALLDRGPTVILLTLGKDGCRLHTRNLEKEIPAFPVEARDTTGAGDSFISAWWATLLSGKSTLSDLEADSDALESACRYGNAAAAITVQKTGAIPALPKPGDIEMHFGRFS